MEITPEILVVDDQKFTHVLMNKALKELNVLVASAFSGQEALDLLPEHDFSVVLMDLRMPGMDGIETARRIRSAPRTADLPIIFITAATGDEEHAMRAYKLGAVDFLYKPVSAPVLKSKVAVFVELFRKRKALQQRSEQYRDVLEAIAEGLITVDMDWNIVEANDSACILFGYGHEHMKRMALPDLMFKENGDLLQEINDAMEHNVTFQVEAQAVHRNGNIFWAEIRGSIFMYSGSPHILAVTQDITARKENELELEEHRVRLDTLVEQRTEQLRLALKELQERKNGQQAAAVPGEAFECRQGFMNALPEPMYLKDTKGFFIGCNTAFADLFGIAPQDIVGKTALDLHPSDVAALLQQKDSELLQSGATQQFSLPFYTPDGARHHVHLHRALYRDTSGQPAGIVSVVLKTDDEQQPVSA
ncbi:PAS domain S-box protein [Salidesulfovibrio onnuriiensis]|uniref:PAS domain S-box protein n=1 Tax=Salidesulfovibrio onnuriiensis TaxID=2583823 RepID=UPI0011CA9385|nr:PAS domain S-box protein [Salidesulfovibrio onnuriiensis]